MKSGMSWEAWKWLTVKKQNLGPEGQKLALAPNSKTTNIFRPPLLEQISSTYFFFPLILIVKTPNPKEENLLALAICPGLTTRERWPAAPQATRRMRGTSSMGIRALAPDVGRTNVVWPLSNVYSKSHIPDPIVSALLLRDVFLRTWHVLWMECWTFH